MSAAPAAQDRSGSGSTSPVGSARLSAGPGPAAAALGPGTFAAAGAGASALLEAAEVFAESLDARQTLVTLARLATAQYADACVVTLLAEESAAPARARFEHVEVAAREPGVRAALQELQQGFASTASAAAPSPRVIRTGQAELFPNLTSMPELRRGIGARARDIQVLARLEPQSAMILPLTARGWTFGAVLLLRLGRAPWPAFTPADLELAEALCRRAAIAVDNARLFRLVERQREYQRLLAETGRLLASSLDGAEALRSVARALVPELADYCAFDLLDDAGQLQRAATAQVGSRLPPAPVAPPQPGGLLGPARVARTGRAELHPEITEAELVACAPDAALRRAGRVAGAPSAVVAPLAAGGRTLGTLTLVSVRSGRRYGPAELRLTEELAQRAALAVENARLFAAERAARAEAEQANRAKFDFLASMSHELRTPLNAIGGYAELLEVGVHGELTPPQHAIIQRIARAGRHLLSLINDILNFSRIDAGKMDFELTSVPLAELMQEVEVMVAPQVRAKSLGFDYADLDGSLSVRADPEKTRQILLNLISNAVKFTPDGGRIRLATQAGAGRVQIRVEDTGIGIPADKLEQIFEPFVQLGRTLSSGHHGTGLGLSISRDLARAMGGDIVAQSTPDHGSTFTLSLPAA